MNVFRHELKRGSKMLIIWSVAVGFMIFICMMMYPEMKNQMEGLNDIFASMGSFTAAFGMDRLSFGTLSGFYGVECGNMLGIGGSFFAAMVGIGMLSKEESSHTAEFLFSHPLSRGRVLTEKLASVVVQVLALNIFCILCSLVSFVIIKEDIFWKELLLFHFAQLLMHLEIACIAFGVSSFVSRGAAGIGLGLATILYFLNIITNISDKAEFLKYVTPFKYAEASGIFSDSVLEWGLMILGMVYLTVFVALGYLVYLKKDLRS